MRNVFAKALALLPFAAPAMTYPPYDLYPYLADSTDNPPLNYTKVCEPGRTGEANATYVVLGTWFPRAYQAVSPAFSGDLTIPAYIDGLPVRKINEAAFITCSNLKSVKIPSTVVWQPGKTVAYFLTIDMSEFRRTTIDAKLYDWIDAENDQEPFIVE
jgi:hypothetical protein